MYAIHPLPRIAKIAIASHTNNENSDLMFIISKVLSTQQQPLAPNREFHLSSTMTAAEQARKVFVGIQV